MIRYTILLLCILIPAQCSAVPITPDRPGFSTGTTTLLTGVWQLEMGIQSSYGTRSSAPDSYTAPLLNLRSGLTGSTEFNLLWDGVQIIDGEEYDTSNLMLGAKHRLFVSDMYNISLLGYLSVQESLLAPFLGLLWDRQLTENTSLFGTLQFATSVESGYLKTNFQPAVGFNYALNDELSSFIEFYADAPLYSARTSIMFDAGVAWLVRSNIQLDFNFGLSLDGRSEDFVGVGMALGF